MSLSSIHQDKDLVKTSTKQTLTKRVTSQNLDTQDLPGASPTKHIPKASRNPEFANQTWDLKHAHPRALTMDLNKAVLNLTNKDIEKSSP